MPCCDGWMKTPGFTPEACAIISSPDSEVYVSLATCWEIALKVSSGKPHFPLDVLEEQLALNQFQLLPVTLSHIIAQANLPLHHRDPFDRMLIVQAQAEGLTLVTRDKTIPQYAIDILAA